MSSDTKNSPLDEILAFEHDSMKQINRLPHGLTYACAVLRMWLELIGMHMHIVLIALWLLLVEVLQSAYTHIIYLLLPVMIGNILDLYVVSKRKACLDPSSVNMLFFLAENLKQTLFCACIVNSLIPLLVTLAIAN